LTEWAGLAINCNDGISVIKKLVNIILFTCTLICVDSGVAQEGLPSAPAASGVDSFMAEGRRLLQQGDLEKALQAFEAVLKRDGTNAEALFRAGTIYLRINQVPKGIEYLERSANAAPTNVKLRLILAQTYEGAQLWEKALDAYGKVSEMAPSSPEAKEAHKRVRILLGRQYGRNGNFEQALQAFTSVLADYPEDVPTLIDEGLTLSYMGRLDEALTVLEKAAAIQPNNELIHRHLGDVFEKKGDMQKSADQYERALQLAPSGAPFIPLLETKLAFVRGALYMAKGKAADARSEYEKVIAADPHNYIARFNLATIYHDLGDLARAQDMLVSLKNDNPADLGVRLRLGALYLEEGDSEQAVHELEEIVAKGEDTPQAQQAAQILANIKSAGAQKPQPSSTVDELIASYRAAVGKNPDDRQAWFELGLLYAQLHRRDEAIEALENVIRLGADDARALAMLGGLYDEAGEADKSIEALSRALDLEHNLDQKQKLARQLALELAKKAFNAGETDEAEKEFKEIIDENKDDYIAHFFLALIYARKEKIDDAIAEYKEVLRIVPGHAFARLSLAAIYEQTGREEEAISEYQAVVLSRAPGLADTARNRLEALKKRVNGYTYDVGYTLNFDSNSNLSPTTPTEELRSDTSGSISYQRKLSGRRIFWGLRFSPVYTVYHQQQFDFLAMEASPSISGVWRDLYLSANYSFSQTDGVLVEQHYNRSQSFYADALKRFKMRALLPFLAADEQRDSIPSAWRVNGSYRSFRSSSSPIFDADSYSIGALLNQSSVNGWSWTGVYTFSNNKNIEPIGNDFAYSSQGINLQLSKSISPKLSANGGYGFTYSSYTHPDSVTRFTQFRVNKFQSISLGLNYSVNDSMRLFCNYVYQRNNSNLPTGFILSTQDVSTAVGIQSPSLGDYHKYGITAGLSLNF
jgi:tetratricopeptide (TPR) repeat protein